MRIRFNSPVILWFTILSLIILMLDTYISPINNYLAITSYFDYNVLSYFTHVLCHSGYDHFIGNVTFILLIGPTVENAYGSKRLLIMIIATAFVTSILNKVFLDTGLLGASGIVYMLIILSSFSGSKKGEIPVTFILVFVLFIGKEFMNSFENDQISQFGHIIGGIFGGLFGFLFQRKILK